MYQESAKNFMMYRGNEKYCIQSFSVKTRIKDHMEDQCINGRTFKWILKMRMTRSGMR
jgi:hypothetical protein